MIIKLQRLTQTIKMQQLIYPKKLFHKFSQNENEIANSLSFEIYHQGLTQQFYHFLRAFKISTQRLDVDLFQVNTQMVFFVSPLFMFIVWFAFKSQIYYSRQNKCYLINKQFHKLVLQLMSLEKRTHTALLKQILADFDLQTRVRKVATESFENILRNNKQAFEFIKQSEKKLTEFQVRLAKTESFNHSIQTFVQNKLKVASQLQKQLSQFNKVFYDKLEETTNQSIIQQKGLNQLKIISQKQTSSIERFQIAIQKLQTASTNLDQKIDQRFQNLFEKQIEQFSKTQSQINERKLELINVMSKISQGYNLMLSKSEKMDILSRDLELYQNEKQLINMKLENLFSQVQQRVLKTQHAEMRKYFDAIIQKNKAKGSKELQDLTTRVLQHHELHNKKQKDIDQQIANNQKDYNKKIKDLSELTERQLKVSIDKVIEQIMQLSYKHEQLATNVRNNYQQYVNSNKSQTNTNNNIMQKIEMIMQNLESKQSHIVEAQSNIMSINVKISNIDQEIMKIVQQSNQRKQQLLKMHQQNKGTGDVNQQMDAIFNNIKTLNDKIQKNAKQISKNHDLNTQKLVNFQQQTRKLQNKVDENHKQITQVVYHNYATMMEIKEKLDMSISQGLSSTKKSCYKYADQLLGSIVSKIQALNSLGDEVNKFKQQFLVKTKEIQIVQQAIAEKIDKISSNFTKIKSDLYIKVQTLAQDGTKRALSVRQMEKIVGQFKEYLSQLNEFVGVCLSSLIWAQCDEKEIYKISSMIEGWVLEIEGKQKVKYRGEVYSRIRLLQGCLDSFVRLGDQLKGSFLQNGKQIFQKIIENNAQLSIKTNKKRALSRKRQSQLPKLYS